MKVEPPNLIHWVTIVSTKCQTPVDHATRINVLYQTVVRCCQDNSLTYQSEENQTFLHNHQLGVVTLHPCSPNDTVTPQSKPVWILNGDVFTFTKHRTLRHSKAQSTDKSVLTKQHRIQRTLRLWQTFCVTQKKKGERCLHHFVCESLLVHICGVNKLQTISIFLKRKVSKKAALNKWAFSAHVSSNLKQMFRSLSWTSQFSAKHFVEVFFQH